MVTIDTFILDEDEAILQIINLFLTNKNYINTRFFTNSSEFLDNFDKSTAIAVVDYNLPFGNGLELHQKIKFINPNCLVILMTDVQDKQVAVEALNNGVFRYVDKTSKDFLFKLYGFLKDAQNHIVELNSKIENKDKLLCVLKDKLKGLETKY
jgi:DNA-binding NtrC family response regulator